jgi:hypothetical protein
VITVSWAQVFAWRLRRQYLEPRAGAATATDAVAIVRRLCGVQAQVGSYAEQAVAARQRTPDAGSVRAALAGRDLLKTWAMRGTLHLLPPDTAGAFGALIASARNWERPVWQRHFGLTPADMRELGERAATALHGRTLTREELIAELAGHAPYAGQLRSGWGTALKPLAWQGLLCHGPSEGGRVTFTSPASWTPGWRAYPDVAEAAAVAVPAYLGAYGPATPRVFGNWLGRQAIGLPMLRDWFAAQGDRLVAVDVAGTRAYHLAEHLDELLAIRPSRAVRLLPPFDQYLLGPGTDDPNVLDPARRSQVSRAAGWIAPIVVSAGRVAGVWSGGNGEPVEVTGFTPIPSAALAAELRRLR